MEHEKQESVCQSAVFDRVFLEHAEDLRNFMYYRTRSLEQAEDLTQEAFIRLWKNCAKVSVEKVKSFIFKVANNLFLNQQEHQKVVLKFQQFQVVQNEEQTPEFLLEEKEFLEQLQGAINDLPEGQREVFLLNRIDKKTYREIAEMLEISVKAVEKRMHKALVKLRKLTTKI